MKRSNFFIALALPSLVIFPFGCIVENAASESQLDEALHAIAVSNDTYFESFLQNNPSIFIDRYADDCSIMMPNAPAMSGPDAPLAFFRMAYDKIGLRNGKFTTTMVYGNGSDFVTEEGLWQSFDRSGKLFDDGKYLVLWKKTPKGWKMFRDSFSSNRNQ